MKSRKTAIVGKKVLRLVFLLIISAVSLYLLNRLEILNLELFRSAFRGGGSFPLLIVFLLLLISLLGGLKFHSVLKLFSLTPKLPDVISANLLSQAVGQWAPGSLAVTEIIRFGLILGIGADPGKKYSNDNRAELKGLLGLSILLDRLIGLGAMFILSGTVAIYLLMQKHTLIRLPALLAVLAGAALGLGCLLLLGPLLTRSRIYRKYFLSQMFPRETEKMGRLRPKGQKALRSHIAATFRFIGKALSDASAQPGRLMDSWGLSLAIATLNPLTLYLAALAVGRRLPLSAILVAVPFTILAILLPLGFAGYGGPQVIAVGAFGLFHVDLETVVAACLVQNTIVVASYTLFGILNAGLVLKKLRGIFKQNKITKEIRRSS